MGIDITIKGRYFFGCRKGSLSLAPPIAKAYTASASVTIDQWLNH
jgi:hypothetical protein